MLINYTPTSPLYIIGTSVVAQEIQKWINDETKNTVDVRLIDKDEYFKLPNGSQCLVGFANIAYRKKLFSEPEFHNRSWVGFIHSSSIVTNVEKVGIGAVIQPMVFTGFNVAIGNFCWVTSFSHIGHGTSIGNNVVINPGTIIAGSTLIGSNVLIGQSSSVKDRLTIGNDIEFCMNSIVSKDITESGKYYGNKRVLNA